MPSPRSKATPAPAEDQAASALPNDPNEPLEDLHAAVLADQEARLSALEGDVASLLEGNRAVQSSLDILVRKLSGQLGENEPRALGDFAEEGTELLQTPDGKLTDSMPPYLRNLDPDSPEFKERMEAWRFEHDMLQVIVNKPSLLQDCYRFNVSINNEVRWFGGAPTDDAAWNEVHTVPRCFVGQLLQMRAVNYGNEETTLRNGTRAVRNPRSTSRAYNVQILYDPAGKRGIDWAQSMLRQPA